MISLPPDTVFYGAAPRGELASLWVLRPGAVGDLVLTFPLLHALAALFPAAAVEVVTSPGAASLFRGTRYGSLVDFDDRRWLPLFSGQGRLAHCPEAMVIFGDDVESVGRRALELGVRLFCGTRPPRRGSDVAHAAELHLRPALALGWRGGAPAPNLLLTEKEKHQGAQLLAATSGAPPGNSVVLHPGSGGKAKNWPLAGYQALSVHLRRRGFIPVVTAGPVEHESGEAERFAGLGQLLPQQGSLRVLAAALAAAAGFVGNDSGITHLAAAAGAVVLALFGPTDPGAWRPLSGTGASPVLVLTPTGEWSAAQQWTARPVAEIHPRQVLAAFDKLT